MTDPDFAAEAARRGVDYLGVIFAANSPRKVDGAKARQIADAARAARPESPPGVVGVFTDGSAAEIVETAAAVSLDVIQLHGEFGDDVVSALKAAGYEVWRLNGSGVEDAVLLDGRDGGKNKLLSGPTVPEDDRPDTLRGQEPNIPLWTGELPGKEYFDGLRAKIPSMQIGRAHV